MSLIVPPPLPTCGWDERYYDLIQQWNAHFTEKVLPLLKTRVNPSCIISLTRWHDPVKHFVRIIKDRDISSELKESIKLLGKDLYSSFFEFCTEIGEIKWLNAINCPSSDPEGDDYKSIFDRHMFQYLKILCHMRETNFPSWRFNSTLRGDTLLWIMETIGTEFVEVVWDKKKGQFVELSQEPDPEPEPEEKVTPEERVAAARAARKARRAPPVKATCASVPAQMTPENKLSILDAAAARQRQQKQKKKQQQQKKKGKRK